MNPYKSTLVLPRPFIHNGRSSIAAPSESNFTSEFGTLFPPAQYLISRWGTTAYYSFPPQDHSTSESTINRVLLVHGVSTPALGMLPLAKKLRSEYPNAHFVLFDLWGHGLSSTPLSPHVPALFHSQIVELLSRLRWPSAHMIGYSFGGVTSTGLLATRPELVESLTLIAPAGLLRSANLSNEHQMCFKGESTEDEARKWVMEFLGNSPLVVPDNWRESVKNGQVVAPAVVEWEQREHEGHVSSVVGIVRDGGVFDQHEVFKKAATTGVRTVALLGEHDEVCSSEDLNDVGMANVHVILGAGHSLSRDNVSEVAPLIVDFWKDLE